TSTIKFDEILGKSVTATLVAPADGSKRYINGIISRFSQGGRSASAQGGGTLTHFRAEVVPQVWTLTRIHQSRIFQQISVPDILTRVLAAFPAPYQPRGNSPKRDSGVQYRETDFAFASRLREEGGIFYFFPHSDGAPQMVAADTPQSFGDVPGPSQL